MRAEGKPLDSDQLLLNLSKKYNETPEKYVREVRDVMSKSNNFSQFIFKEEEVSPDPK